MSSQKKCEYNEVFLAQFKDASTKSSSEASKTSVEASHPPSSMEAVFSKVASMMASSPELSHGSTWNGDINYAELTTDQRDIASSILGFTQKLVMPEKEPVKGKGSKRPAQSALPLDPVENLETCFCMSITTELNSIIAKIKTMSKNEQAIYTCLLFVTMFRERAIVSGSRSSIGKGHRSFSYLIFRILHKEMPLTAIECIPCFVHFGYWGDLNAICAYYIKDGNDKRVVTKCINMMLESFDKSVRSLPGTNNRGFLKKNGEVMTHSEFRRVVDSHRFKIKYFSDVNIEKHYNCVYNDNCAKFIPSEGKRHEHLRPILIAGMLWDGDMTRALGAVKFGQATLTRLTTILRRLGNVVETRMSANDWTFDIKKVPAGALHKHKKAFLNEDLDEELSMYETDGNRTHDPARIALRQTYLDEAIKGAIKGTGLDSIKFARELRKSIHTASHGERVVVHAQFMALVDDIRKQLQKEYDASLESWVTEGSNPSTKPLNPFNVIATIDVSESMECANVLDGAIVLGIITTLLSNLGNTFITFSDTPLLINLDVREGTTIYDWYEQVKISPWGGSTNIDKSMQLLLNLFKGVRESNPSFDGRVNHIIFTDGQFNPYFAQFTSESRYCGYGNTGADYSSQWNPFAKRMETLFHQNKFALPLTCFWSMNASSPGFPAHSKYNGLTLAEGMSHGLLVNTLGNKVTFKNTISGDVVADTDPLTSFLQGMARDDFTSVINMVLSTSEGVFSDQSTHPHVQAFIAAYTK